MASLSSTPTRSAPLQERSARRIAHLLEIAASLVSEVGYDAMTMTAIAERADTSIGALYRWFPDKASVAQALRSQYAAELRAGWTPFIQSAKSLTIAEFSEALIDRMVAFCHDRPAYLPLVAAPIQFTKDPAARRHLRDQFIELFQAHNPAITPARGLLVSNVSLQIVKSLVATYAETPEQERAPLIQEFKTALTLYLSKSLG